MNAPIPFPMPERGDLRHELAAAIQLHRDAEKRAHDAKVTFDCANSLLAEAADSLERCKSSFDAEQRAATQKHAQAMCDAFRRGHAPPCAPALPEADHAAMSGMLANHRALELAAAELARERDAAAAAAAAAADAVDKLVDAIIDAEAVQLAGETILAVETYWRLRDRLVGVSRLDHARRAGSRLTDLLKDVELRTDRRKALVAQNRLYIEDHNYARHREELEAIAEQRWRDYAARLAVSPDAVFEE